MVSSQQPARVVQVVNTGLQHLEQLEQLQKLVFYTLTNDELFSVEHYRSHLRIFPEGQFSAAVNIEDREIVVGSTTSFRTTWEFVRKPHRFVEATNHGWLTNHDPDGDWLYGADMAVLPLFRGMGIARRLYNARQALVQRLNLRGEVAGGMIPGYERYRAYMVVEEYVKRVAAGELNDPTLSMQMAMGFVPLGVLRDHITDPRADNCAALIVRENPHFNANERS